MVKQRQVWEAADGTFHKTKPEAEEADIRLSLRQLEFRCDTIDAIIKHRHQLIRVLTQEDMRDALNG